ncbi:MAG: hypothetical protein ACRDT8_08815 [Micromonosporaceae bacterium]
MRLTSLATLTLIALALGFLTGRVYERAVRAWVDLRTAKAQVPILRAAARLLSANAVGWVVVSAVVAAWSLHTLATKGQ